MLMIEMLLRELAATLARQLLVEEGQNGLRCGAPAPTTIYTLIEGVQINY
jgi:hypothetical protein